MSLIRRHAGRRAQEGDTIKDHTATAGRMRNTRLGAGPYWHITSDSNFKLGARRPFVARGMGYEADGPLLYVTAQPSYWHAFLLSAKRAWAVQIDLSQVPATALVFGPEPAEIQVHKPHLARVVQVLPLRKAAEQYEGFGGAAHWLWAWERLANKDIAALVPRQGWTWADARREVQNDLLRNPQMFHHPVLVHAAERESVVAEVHTQSQGDLFEVYDPRIYEDEEEAEQPDPGWERYYFTRRDPAMAEFAAESIIEQHQAIVAAVRKFGTKRWSRWHPCAQDNARRRY